MLRGLIRRAVAAAVAVACAFVTVVALGAAAFYGLALVLPAWGAACVVAGVFAIIALSVTLIFLSKADPDAHEDEDEDEDDSALGIGGRALGLFRQRPVLGLAAALAGGFIFLRNPALVSLVTAAFVEKPKRRRRL